MDIQQSFSRTAELIQSEVANMTTKAEILAYLAQVKDYTNSTMKLTRAYMKGVK
jgi:hypothetical protein